MWTFDIIFQLAPNDVWLEFPNTDSQIVLFDGRALAVRPQQPGKMLSASIPLTLSPVEPLTSEAEANDLAQALRDAIWYLGIYWSVGIRTLNHRTYAIDAASKPPFDFGVLPPTFAQAGTINGDFDSAFAAIPRAVALSSKQELAVALYYESFRHVQLSLQHWYAVSALEMSITQSKREERIVNVIEELRKHAKAMKLEADLREIVKATLDNDLRESGSESIMREVKGYLPDLGISEAQVEEMWKLRAKVAHGSRLDGNDRGVRSAIVRTRRLVRAHLWHCIGSESPPAVIGKAPNFIRSRS